MPVTNIQIPLDDVGEGIISALNTALAGPLSLKSCYQGIFEPLTANDQFSEIFPAIRLMEPGWHMKPYPGANPVLPWVEGTLNWVLSYGRTFALTDTNETWGRQVVQDMQQIAAVLFRADMQLAGYTPPAGLTIKKIYPIGGQAIASADAEDLGIRIAEVQIRIEAEVSVKGNR